MKFSGIVENGTTDDLIFVVIWINVLDSAILKEFLSLHS